MKIFNNKIILIAVYFSITIISSAYSAINQYTYDNLNRLIMVIYENGVTIEYTYDEAGNRLSKNIITGILTGDINNSKTVDLHDAILALKISAGQTPNSIWSDADANYDERIGVEDAVYILQKVAGLR